MSGQEKTVTWILNHYFLLLLTLYIVIFTVLISIYDLFYHFDTSNWSLFTQFGYLQKCDLFAFWADS